MDLKEFLKLTRGKWIAVGGNRWIDSKTFKKVESLTRKVIENNSKIITGGAEGVDHATTKACIKYGIAKGHLKIFMPQTLKKQYQHYRRLEGEKKAKKLLEILSEVEEKYPGVIKENHKKFSNYRKACDYRNRVIGSMAEGALIFKPKGSKGTQDVVKAIKARKIPYLIFE